MSCVPVHANSYPYLITRTNPFLPRRISHHYHQLFFSSPLRIPRRVQVPRDLVLSPLPYPLSPPIPIPVTSGSSVLETGLIGLNSLESKVPSPPSLSDGNSDTAVVGTEGVVGVTSREPRYVPFAPCPCPCPFLCSCSCPNPSPNSEIAGCPCGDPFMPVFGGPTGDGNSAIAGCCTGVMNCCGI